MFNIECQVKYLKFVFWMLLVFILACNINGPDIPDGITKQSFIITDTLGNECTEFKSGESFVLRHCLTNISEDTLRFYTCDTRPPIIFNIFTQDTLVTSSASGAFSQVPVTYDLLSNDSLVTEWEGPLPTVILSPGLYEARLEYPGFDPGVTVDELSAIEFEITENPNLIIPEFSMTDTLGVETYYFKVGESFFIEYYLVNTSPDTMYYTKYDSGPDIIFYILKYQTVVASSIDGLGVHMPVTREYLAPGDTMYARWKAPTTPYQDPKVTLGTGLHWIEVSYPEFDDHQIAVLPNKYIWVNE